MRLATEKTQVALSRTSILNTNAMASALQANAMSALQTEACDEHVVEEGPMREAGEELSMSAGMRQIVENQAAELRQLRQEVPSSQFVESRSTAQTSQYCFIYL